ncbi:hypothetical protein ACCS75_35600, partial [Rhizobium ruizarguesonis]
MKKQPHIQHLNDTKPKLPQLQNRTQEHNNQIQKQTKLQQVIPINNHHHIHTRGNHNKKIKNQTIKQNNLRT